MLILGVMEIIESVVWFGAGFGPTLLALQVLARREEKAYVKGLKLGRSRQPKPEMEVIH